MEARSVHEIGWPTIWRVLTAIAIVYILYAARDIFSILLVAIVVSLGFEPVVSFLEKIRIHRVVGTISLFLFLFACLTIFFYFFIPVISAELVGFVGQFSKTVSALSGLNIPKAFVSNFSLSFDRAVNYLSAANFSISGTVGAIFRNIILFFATVIISFYLMLERDGTERLLRIILPLQYERPILTIFVRFKNKIRKWFGAQLVLSLIMVVLVGLGLWILNVPYYPVIAILAGIFELVPVMGPIFTGLIAFLMAVSESVSLGLYAVVFFFIIQQLESNVFAPLVMGRALRVHPVVVIVAILAGADIAGFIGIILAVPVAVMVQEIFDYLSDRKRNRQALGI